MCGILAILGIEEKQDSAEYSEIKKTALKCSKRLRSRGPDWSGMAEFDGNIICHERLAIVDVDSGSQPLISDDGNIVLAVNGEIYNHKELRKTLIDKDAVFKTKSDCEIIIHLYQKYGFDFVDKLNGIFGFVLYDKKKGLFMIARDHMGIIPLYRGWDKDGVAWVASELKGLHDHCYVFEEFLPGLYYRSDKDVVKRWYKPFWWDVKYMPTKKADPKLVRKALFEATERQLMADVPCGVLLSGGLDSSVISAIAANIIKRKVKEDPNYEWPTLHSFSIGLKGSPDLAAAKKVAKHIGTHHHSYEFTIEEGINAIRDVVYHLETYDVTTIRAGTPMYLMSRKVKTTGVKVVLSGEGADEIMASYLYNAFAPNKEELHAEIHDKLKQLHLFDCLRANKATAAWGVEARVPFLDKEFLDVVMDIDPQDKMSGLCGKSKGKHKIEKYFLRKAFEDMLPEEIVWRQKEQFSDGVGYSWIDTIKLVAEKQVSDKRMKAAKYRFPHNTPWTKEGYYIRQIYEEFYPQQAAIQCVPGGKTIACSTSRALEWHDSFKSMADNSGRSVGVHNSAYKEKLFEEEKKEQDEK